MKTHVHKSQAKTELVGLQIIIHVWLYELDKIWDKFQIFDEILIDWLI